MNSIILYKILEALKRTKEVKPPTREHIIDVLRELPLQGVDLSRSDAPAREIVFLGIRFYKYRII